VHRLLNRSDAAAVPKKKEEKKHSPTLSTGPSAFQYSARRATMDDEMVTVGRLESEAVKRKQRLQAMRRMQQPQQQQQQKQQDEQHASDDSHDLLPKPMFRSYQPLDGDLQKATVPAAQPEEVKPEIKNALESASEAPVLKELDLENLAPRKPDWDLKRHVAKKLAKLEKRTQRTIAVLIRERLEQETKQSGDLMAPAVDAAAAAAAAGTPWK